MRWMAVAVGLAMVLPGCLTFTSSTSTTTDRTYTVTTRSDPFPVDPQLARSGRWEAPFDGGAGSVEFVLRGENGKKERDRDHVDLRPINGRAGRSLHDYSLMA